MYLRRMRGRGSCEAGPYWALVESRRTERGPRQRVVAYLGDLDSDGRTAVVHAAEGSVGSHQGELFRESRPEWVEVDVSGVRVERDREFGGPWLGLRLLGLLGLPEALASFMPSGREAIPWSVMAEVLVLSRLCDPSSELAIAERFYERSALEDLLGVPRDRVNEDRLYRALDHLLGRKAELESHLRARMGELFGLTYDLLLYDVTSMYFEGQCPSNPEARYGYSRDHRPDCKQVCIGLVVSHCGMPLGYEVFEGNRSDVTTVEEMVTRIESRYGRADRIWVMDRGMISEETLEFLRDGGRRYIVGTPRGELRSFELELLHDRWESIREGVEVKLCRSGAGDEVFVLCRSRARGEKERSIRGRFELRIEEGLQKLSAGCMKRRESEATVSRRVGGLLSKNSRAARLFDIQVTNRGDGGAAVTWSEVEERREWAELSEGCYLLRSNIMDWTPADLWTAYVHLTEAEAAFRIQKSDLRIRPIWHQRADRVRAHIMVCFLAYVLWKTLGKLCEGAGLGDEPRQVFDEIAQLRLVDVILPTRTGIEIRKRCITRPTRHQAVLLQRLGLHLPKQVSPQPV